MSARNLLADLVALFDSDHVRVETDPLRALVLISLKTQARTLVSGPDLDERLRVDAKALLDRSKRQGDEIEQLKARVKQLDDLRGRIDADRMEWHEAAQKESKLRAAAEARLARLEARLARLVIDRDAP